MTVKLIEESEIMSASLLEVSTDDGPSHANTSQEKVLSKETGDIPVKHKSKSAKLSPRQVRQQIVQRLSFLHESGNWPYIGST